MTAPMPCDRIESGAATAIVRRMEMPSCFEFPATRRKLMLITVETNVAAPIAEVWRAYATPEDIKQWNAASDDWHTTASSVGRRQTRDRYL
jgi:uncharacterized protein YndB with AHSA1/START domain